MAENSSIQWTDASWNFVTGCTKISDECLNCYITKTPPFRMAGRKFDKPGIGGTTGVTIHPEKLTLPLRWRNPRKVFVNSLADLFHEAVAVEVIAKAFAVMSLAPQHTFQILTKRHARMKTLLRNPEFRLVCEEEQARLINDDATPLPRYRRDALTSKWWSDFATPLPNVHLGVSAGDQKWADIRIRALVETPAAVRFVSAEPLLGPIKLHRGHGYCPTHDFTGGFCSGPCPDLVLPNWLIVGGESGPGARPMETRWARDLVADCRDAGIAPFVKQLGTAWARDWTVGGKTVAAQGDTKGGDMQYWPADLRVREYPQPVTVSS